jgi:hypothetical protein
LVGGAPAAVRLPTGAPALCRPVRIRNEAAHVDWSLRCRASRRRRHQRERMGPRDHSASLIRTDLLLQMAEGPAISYRCPRLPPSAGWDGPPEVRARPAGRRRSPPWVGARHDAAWSYRDCAQLEVHRRMARITRASIRSSESFARALRCLDHRRVDTPTGGPGSPRSPGEAKPSGTMGLPVLMGRESYAR